MIAIKSQIQVYKIQSNHFFIWRSIRNSTLMLNKWIPSVTKYKNIYFIPIMTSGHHMTSYILLKFSTKTYSRHQLCFSNNIDLDYLSRNYILIYFLLIFFRKEINSSRLEAREKLENASAYFFWSYVSFKNAFSNFSLNKTFHVYLHKL